MRYLGILVAVAAIALGASACGSSDNTATAAEQTQIAGVDETAEAVAEGTETLPFSVIVAKLEARASRVASHNSSGQVQTMADVDVKKISEGEALMTMSVRSRSTAYPSITGRRTFVKRVTYDPVSGHIDTIKPWDG